MNDDVDGYHPLPRWIARLPNRTFLRETRRKNGRIDRAELGPAHKVVLGAIAWFSTMKNRKAHATVETIAEEVGTSPSTVKRLLADLAHVGLVACEYRRGATNTYTITKPDRDWHRVEPPPGLKRGPGSESGTGPTSERRVSPVPGPLTKPPNGQSESGTVPTSRRARRPGSESGTGPTVSPVPDYEQIRSPTDRDLPALGALRASGRSPAAAVTARASSPPEPSEHDSGVSLVLGTDALGVTEDGAGAEPAIDAPPSELRDSESALSESRSRDVPGSDGAARERAQAADDAGARDHDRPRVADHLRGLDDAPRRPGSTGPAPRRAGEIARAPTTVRRASRDTSRVTAAVTHASRRSR